MVVLYKYFLGRGEGMGRRDKVDVNKGGDYQSWRRLIEGGEGVKNVQKLVDVICERSLTATNCVKINSIYSVPQKNLKIQHHHYQNSGQGLSQKTFTCSKSLIETLKKRWKLFKVNNKDNKTKSGAFIVNFEHISHLS